MKSNASDHEDSDIGPMPAVSHDQDDEDVGPMPHAEVEAEDSRKRSTRVEEDEDGDDIGPLPPPKREQAPRKKRKAKQDEHLYLDQIPATEMYERSFMHRDQLAFVAVTKSDFLITTSVDGHLKFWKKTEKGVEFVKHYRSHLGAIHALPISADGLLLATVSEDKSIKVYDIVNFDMINMIRLDYVPRTACWIYRHGQAQALLAVSDQASNKVYIYDGKNQDSKPVACLETLHQNPVALIAYHPHAHCVVSIDTAGMLEYWSGDEPYDLPAPPRISWEFKSDTDLYEFVKAKCIPSALVFSPDYSMFATYGLADRQVRLFKFRSGKMIRKYDESLQVISEMQQAGTAVHSLDDMEFGRRLAIDRELEKSRMAAFVNLTFDESGSFLLYPTLLGIKVVSIHSNNVKALIGKGETVRFLNVALYQGNPKKKGPLSLAAAASENPTLQKMEGSDPTVICTSYKKKRFFLFTKREPDSGDLETAHRDVFNEKPSREEQLAAQPVKKLGTAAILRTTYGDIFLKLFPDFAPKTVENFTTHAKNGYYNNHLFHRVIRGFMIQTGDPTGTGQGGESIWGGDFADEFHPQAKHEKPYTLSMANCGPNTNGSQFFITTVPAPWLDNKHTVFGRVTAGMDIVHKIENAKCRGETPFDEIKIVNIEVRQE